MGKHEHDLSTPILEDRPAPVEPRAAAPARPIAVPAQPALRPAPMKLRYDVDSLDNRDPWLIEQVVRFAERVIYPYHRAEITGVERVPHGKALYIGNHNGGSMPVDSFIFGSAVYRRWGLEGTPHVLAHDLPLLLPGLHHLFVKLGALRASHDNARKLFEAGHKVMVYPGGHEETMRPFRDRNKICFFGHRGYIRTALRHDVPIVPVVAQGAHATSIIIDDAKWLARLTHLDRLMRLKSWPITISLPWGLTLFPPPIYLPLPVKIRMEIMEPIHFERSDPDAERDEAYVAQCAQIVESRMQETLDRLAHAT